MPLLRRESIRLGVPTLFLLHGWGSDADDLFSMTSPFGLPFSIVALQAPDRHP
ncbi:phospholipase, partial [bacterium]